MAETNRPQRHTIQVSLGTHELMERYRKALHQQDDPHPTIEMDPPSWDTHLMIVSADALTGLFRCPHHHHRWLKCTDCQDETDAEVVVR